MRAVSVTMRPTAYMPGRISFFREKRKFRNGCREYVLPLDVMCCATMTTNVISSVVLTFAFHRASQEVYYFFSIAVGGRVPRAPAGLQQQEFYSAAMCVSLHGPHLIFYRRQDSIPFLIGIHSYKERILLNPFLFLDFHICLASREGFHGRTFPIAYRM